MTTALAELRLAQPTTVNEAIATLLSHPQSRLVAGGTDLLVNIRRGISRPDLLIDISRIGELAEINTSDGGMKIGAGVTIAAIAANASIGKHYRAAGGGRRSNRRARSPQSGNARRQSVPRYPLHLLQSERMVAEREFILPQEPRRYMSRCPAGKALSRRLQRRSCACSACSRRRGRHRRRAGHSANSLARALCRGRQGASHSGGR